MKRKRLFYDDKNTFQHILKKRKNEFILEDLPSEIWHEIFEFGNFSRNFVRMRLVRETWKEFIGFGRFSRDFVGMRLSKRIMKCMIYEHIIKNVMIHITKKNQYRFLDYEFSFMKPISFNIHEMVVEPNCIIKYICSIYKIHMLDISPCYNVTNEAFQYLKGIHTLVLPGCNQETITDKAFQYLKGIHTLHMSYCRQKTITSKAFEYLKGIHTLYIPCCNQKNNY